MAIQTARRGYDAASMLGDPALTAQLAVQRSLGLTWIGARRRVTAILDEALAAITPVADPSAADTSPARGYAQAEGTRDGQALLHLDMADRIAPQGIRDVPVAREVLLDLDRRARRRVWELDSLRNRFGIRPTR